MRILLSELNGTSDDEGLVAGLARHAATLGNPDGLTVAVRGPVPRLPLSPAVEAQLLAIGREALANVVKHSAARRAWVSIESSAGAGVPGDPRQRQRLRRALDRPGHYGLESMRTRAAEAGAALTILSVPGQGTIVRVVSSRVMERRSTASEAVIRVLVVDDHEVVRRGLHAFLDGEPDLEVIADASGGEEALEVCARLDSRGAALPTSSSWTCRCLRWTASRPRAASGTATRRWRSSP